MERKQHILLIGPFPPPAGGISVHLQRLHKILSNSFPVDVIDDSPVHKDGIFNIRSLNPFVYLNKIAKADLVFIHSGNKFFKKLHILFAKIAGKKIIITLHGYGPKRNQPFKKSDEFFFNLAHKIIVVNETIPDRVTLPKEKTILKHAFLPPTLENEPALAKDISEWVFAAKQEGKTILCANASRLDTHLGQDLYGLDLCIELVNRLKRRGLLVSMVFTVSNISVNKEKFEEAKTLIQTLGIENEFLLINGVIPFVRLIEISDIVLRPTNTDGDALTIREAIYFGKPTIVSDVVKRPNEAILFKNRDIDDFEFKLSKLLLNPNIERNKVESKENTNESLSLFYSNLIKEVLGEKAVKIKGVTIQQKDEAVL